MKYFLNYLIIVLIVLVAISCSISFLKIKMFSVNQKLSLFIPHVFANLSKDFVMEVLEEGYNLGKISHIDFVEKTGADGKLFHAVYVHFDFWNEDKITMQFQQDILNSEKGFRLVYDSPW